MAPIEPSSSLRVPPIARLATVPAVSSLPLRSQMAAFSRGWQYCWRNGNAVLRRQQDGAGIVGTHPPADGTVEGTVDCRILRGTSARRYGTCTARVFCLRHRVEKSGTGQSSPASFKRLATIPAVWRKGSLNSTLIDSQNWMATSEKTGGRPGRPSCGARQVMSSSTQIKRDPSLRSDAL